MSAYRCLPERSEGPVPVKLFPEQPLHRVASEVHHPDDLHDIALYPIERDGLLTEQRLE